jgi:tetratricopeptide (TPR) repeat protein
MRNKDIDSIAYLLKRAKETNQPKPIVFLGAGASISAGIPGSIQIIKDILKTFKDKPEIKKLSVEERTYYNLMGCLNTEERHQLLRDYISNKDVKINVTHIYLAQMLKEGYVDYVLTVNFDDLFLRACALFNFIPPVYDISILKDFTTTNLTEKSVTYLHGQHHGFWLLNTDEELEKVKEYIPTVFDRICNKRTWIVVGYSGEDPIFDQIARLGHFTNELFWVGYNENLPNENVQEKLINKPNSNASFVSGYDADSFFLKLHSELKLDTPDIFNKPFSFLKDLMGNIRDVEDVTTKGKHQKLFEKVKERSELALKQVDASIKQYEQSDPTGALTVEDINRDQLKQKLIEAIIKDEFDKVGELPDKADLKDAELRRLLAKFYGNWGLKISDEIRDKKDANEYQKVIDKYKTATELDDLNGDIFNNWGVALVQIGQISNEVSIFEQAIEKYKKAIEVNSEDALAYYNWGLALSFIAQIKNDIKINLESIEKYQKAISIDPTDGSAYQNLSNQLIRVAKRVNEKERIKYLNEAIEISKTGIIWGKAAYNLACCYALLKNKALAFDLLENVLKKNEISIKHVLADDDWKDYWEDDEFKELIKKYSE